MRIWRCISRDSCATSSSRPWPRNSRILRFHSSSLAECTRSSLGSIQSVNSRFDNVPTTTTTTRRLPRSIASRHALPRTRVSVRSLYMFELTIAAGTALSGFRSLSATTVPVSIGKPWWFTVRACNPRAAAERSSACANGASTRNAYGMLPSSWNSSSTWTQVGVGSAWNWWPMIEIHIVEYTRIRSGLAAVMRSRTVS